MKKLLFLFCVLFVFSAGACAFEFFNINAQKENVSFTVLKEEGDKKYANGLNVRFISQHSNRLKWKTDYTFGQTDKVKTDFEFHKKCWYEYFEASPYFNIYSPSPATIYSTENGFITLSSTGINKAYLELAQEAQPDVTAEKTIYPKDYYEYYPIYIDLGLDNYGLTIDENVFSSISEDNGYTEEEKDFIKRLTEFLRIPVLEDEKITITLKKSAEGDIYEKDSFYSGDDCYSLGTVNAFSNDTIYFITNIRTESGNKVDTSLIPGGYGIYAFDYTLKDEGKRDGTSNAYFGDIENIYPLNEDNEITGFFLSGDESMLYLFTNEDGKAWLTVIDAKTRECLQRLKMSDSEMMGFDLGRSTQDYLVLRCGDYDGESYYAVVTIEKGGKHKLEYMVKYNYDSSSFLYENGLLYTVYYGFWDQDIFCNNNCGFTVLVYSKDGLKYYGEYLSSLNTGNKELFFSGYYVFAYGFQDGLSLAA